MAASTYADGRGRPVPAAPKREPVFGLDAPAERVPRSLKEVAGDEIAMYARALRDFLSQDPTRGAAGKVGSYARDVSNLVGAAVDAKGAAATVGKLAPTAGALAAAFLGLKGGKPKAGPIKLPGLDPLPKEVYQAAHEYLASKEGRQPGSEGENAVLQALNRFGGLFRGTAKRVTGQRGSPDFAKGREGDPAPELPLDRRRVPDAKSRTTLSSQKISEPDVAAKDIASEGVAKALERMKDPAFMTRSTRKYEVPAGESGSAMETVERFEPMRGAGYAAEHAMRSAARKYGSPVGRDTSAATQKVQGVLKRVEARLGEPVTEDNLEAAWAMAQTLDTGVGKSAKKGGVAKRGLGVSREDFEEYVKRGTVSGGKYGDVYDEAAAGDTSDFDIGTGHRAERDATARSTAAELAEAPGVDAGARRAGAPSSSGSSSGFDALSPDQRAAVRQAWGRLSEPDRQLLEAVFTAGGAGDVVTQADIAKGLGLTQPEVSRRVPQLMEQIRSLVAEGKPPEVRKAGRPKKSVSFSDFQSPEVRRGVSEGTQLNPRFRPAMEPSSPSFDYTGREVIPFSTKEYKAFTRVRGVGAQKPQPAAPTPRENLRPTYTAGVSREPAPQPELYGPQERAPRYQPEPVQMGLTQMDLGQNRPGLDFSFLQQVPMRRPPYPAPRLDEPGRFSGQQGARYEAAQADRYMEIPREQGRPIRRDLQEIALEALRGNPVLSRALGLDLPAGNPDVRPYPIQPRFQMPPQPPLAPRYGGEANYPTFPSQGPGAISWEEIMRLGMGR